MKSLTESERLPYRSRAGKNRTHLLEAGPTHNLNSAIRTHGTPFSLCSQTKTLICHPSPKTRHTKTLPELKSLSGGGEKVTRPKPALAPVSGAARVGWVPATECGAGQTVTHGEVARARHFLRVTGSHTNPSPLTPRGLLVRSRLSDSRGSSPTSRSVRRGETLKGSQPCGLEVEQRGLDETAQTSSPSSSPAFRVARFTELAEL